MIAIGSCYDNAAAGYFFGLLKYQAAVIPYKLLSMSGYDFELKIALFSRLYWIIFI